MNPAAIRALGLVVAWLISIALGLFVLASAVSAQTGPMNCARHDRVLAGLAKGYGEVPVMIGMDPQNRVVEITASPDTGTWSIIVSTPDGQTCLVASGQSFDLVPFPPSGVPG